MNGVQYAQRPRLPRERRLSANLQRGGLFPSGSLCAFGCAVIAKAHWRAPRQL